MIRYAVMGGWVKGRDGQERYMSPRQLVKLSNVRAEECIMLEGFGDLRSKGFSRQYIDKLIWLVPRQDGYHAENPATTGDDGPGTADGEPRSQAAES